MKTNNITKNKHTNKIDMSVKSRNNNKTKRIPGCLFLYSLVTVEYGELKKEKKKKREQQCRNENTNRGV